jgi:hypothetical protein
VATVAVAAIRVAKRRVLFIEVPFEAFWERFRKEGD